MAPFCGPLARDSAPLDAGVVVTTALSPTALTVTSVDIVTTALASAVVVGDDGDVAGAGRWPGPRPWRR